MKDDISPGVALRFGLTVDGVTLGAFTGVKGLIVENEVFEWAEGGENGFVHRLPGRAKYKDVTLSRNTDKDTVHLAAWFEEARKDHVLRTAQVTAYDSDEQSVAVWSLVGVWPLRYTGPVLDSVLGGLARESLDLAHAGFTVTVA
jgi:phage tail-like protein